MTTNGGTAGLSFEVEFWFGALLTRVVKEQRRCGVFLMYITNAELPPNIVYGMDKLGLYLLYYVKTNAVHCLNLL